MTTSAAIYLRSSKDRADVSIDTQRQALHGILFMYQQAEGWGVMTPNLHR